MANQMPGKCPVCGERLQVTRLHCDYCDTSLEGRFELSKFSRLSKEQLEFVEVFIACRGNIKEVERVLGISYPTVRNRLEGVITSLGYQVSREQPKVDEAKRREVLAALDKGEISAEEAIKRLRGQ